jgi:hypothetical protein
VLATEGEALRCSHDAVHECLEPKKEKFVEEALGWAKTAGMGKVRGLARVRQCSGGRQPETEGRLTR